MVATLGFTILFTGLFFDLALFTGGVGIEICSDKPSKLRPPGEASKPMPTSNGTPTRDSKTLVLRPLLR